MLSILFTKILEGLFMQQVTALASDAPCIETLQGLPEIGKTYLVLCVRTSSSTMYGNKWWPVTTPKPHSDHEYGVGPDAEHHHFDPRFMSDEDLGIAIGKKWPKEVRP